MTPHIWNRRNPACPSTAIYVGRPTKWGNPFIIGRDGDRATVITKFRTRLRNRPDLRAAARRELRGHDLSCWCSPLDCHAAVWIEIANS